jgi:hypothetical protein
MAAPTLPAMDSYLGVAAEVARSFSRSSIHAFIAAIVSVFVPTVGWHDAIYSC